MLFNSGVFFLFFVIVYTAYLLLYKKNHWQNVLLLIASYIFYGSWDWRFLSLIIISTLVDFYIGQAIARTPGDTVIGQTYRKRLLALSVGVNLGILGFFKYFNFFADSVVAVLGYLGLQADPITLNVILPVGISFYTFQTMSYSIDIYRQRLLPTKSLLNFAVYVAFFPQLVAGPIERAVNLLPQIEEPRRITAAQISTGLYLLLWGYFKKIVVADNAGLVADRVFNNYTTHTDLNVLVGILAFALQIYGDFSGYSDIARGLSRLMGFELMVNFRLPYFALNPTDFWNRWHISLSTWLRDYLYIPLGGNREGKWQTYRNLMVTMLLGGLWHGAAWHFVIWGGYHGLILILYRLFEKRPIHKNPWGGDYNYLVVLLRMAFMFVLTLIGWLIFRTPSLEQLWFMVTHTSLRTTAETPALLTSLILFPAPFFVLELYQYLSRDLLIFTKWPQIIRVILYACLLIWLFIFGVREPIEFIYFQF